MISKERAVELVFGPSRSDNFPDCSETPAELVMNKFRLIAEASRKKGESLATELVVTDELNLDPVSEKGKERVIFNPGRCAI